MDDKNLRLSLFMLRIGVFIVMLMWTLDKFIRPDHAAQVFEGFYHITSGKMIMYALGAIELVIIVMFVLGLFKRFSYGFILALHAISTFSSYKQYLNPFEKVNLLFFAAIPMLAACFALYLLREHDTKYTLKLS